MFKFSTLALACAAGVLATRDVFLLDYDWKFELVGAAPQCPSSVAWPVNLNNKQVTGLTQAPATDAESCLNACCADSTCAVYQWCADGPCSPVGSCWIGALGPQTAGNGWISQARNVSAPSPMPSPGPAVCTQPGCSPSTNDAAWRSLNVPHDFVVENNFSQTADKSHGYLPYGKAWYRKHLSFPSSANGASMWIDFEAIQTTSAVYFNGYLLGTKAYGYTNSRYFLESSQINWSGDNLLAVYVDATQPDSWWYDGGGIYRHVWLTVVTTPGPYIAPWGVYAPSNATGAITWSADGVPSADGEVTPYVEVWTNATSPASQSFSLTVTVTNPAGAVVGSASGSGSVTAAAPVTWSPSSPIALPAATLWHLVSPPNTPALYTVTTTLTVAGNVVDSTTVTIGVRRTRFDAATGFYLNDVSTKIMGTANHQDAAAVGVAVPDHLQTWRVAKLKEMGVNGWRTAHNPPNPGLLDAMDTMGMVVWDETHRNGNLPELELLIKRDRNHPCVVIWSLCNEVLCNTNNWIADALSAKALIKQLDPLGGRPVSANQNGWIGPNTPLDLQGFDYSTGNYDNWHKEAPSIPSMSSETSSAVSDRSEYVNNATSGHVSGYDNNYPGWGESAEQAWGGVGEGNGQGILTRPFICGGWTWTGHDYRGEPTPYGWPDVNSHFGIIDAAGFPKDRFYWYQTWFIPSQPMLYLFPHWDWAPGQNVSLWAFANADAVELIVNGVSQGTKNMTQYSHVEWDNIPWVAGSVQALSYKAGSSTPVAVAWRNTTGPASQLSISVKDGVGSTLVTGCADVAYIQVALEDANGALVHTASDVVTFTVSGPAVIAGTANGDPAGLVNNKSPSRPAFHGLVLGVVLTGDESGPVKVTASAVGYASVSLVLNVEPQPADFNTYWCKNNARL